MAAPVAAAQSPRLAGLDGLRGVAVLAVILYHLGLPHVAEAGFLGVDVFFTISGFIITALLLREHSRSGRLDFVAFYQRRARRLLPPTFAMVAVVATLSPVLAPQAVQRLGSDIPAAFFYVSNWWQIVSKQSYFESFDSPPLLQHLWSLAVEEQYYIVWPVVVLGVLRSAGRRGLGLLSLGLAVASTLWMAWLYEVQVDGGDPSRVYLGTDTHLMGLLVGSALACVFDPWQPAGQRWGTARPRAARPGPRLGPWAVLNRGQGLAGSLALAGLLLMIVGLHDAKPLVYRGGLLGAALLSAAVLVAAVQPGTWVQRALSKPLMQWAGARSFSLYLWHWPVFVWLRPVGDDSTELLAVTAARLALTVLAAELSYRLIERPAPPVGPVAPAWQPRAAVLAGSLVATLSTALVVWAPAPTGTGQAAQAYFQTWPLDTRAGHPVDLLADGAPQYNGLQPVVWYRGWQAPGAATRVAPFAADNADGCVNVIGDSVMLGARDHLGRSIHGVRVDAEVGRQGNHALKLLKEFRAQAALCSSVVLHLGTNGYLSESPYREMLTQLKDRPLVVLVNIHANRQWTAANNSLIGRAGREFDNIRVIDWHTISAARPEFFVADGVHLSGAGIQAMTREIRRAVGLSDGPGPYRATLQRRHSAAAAASQAAGAPVAADPEPAAHAPAPTDG